MLIRGTRVCWGLEVLLAPLSPSVTNPRPAPILCWGTEPQTNHRITSSSGMGLLKRVEKCLLEWGLLPLSPYEIVV